MFCIVDQVFGLAAKFDLNLEQALNAVKNWHQNTTAGYKTKTKAVLHHD